MRVTRQNMRGCSRKHNDRNFDLEKAVHLNPNPERENVYRNIYNDTSMTFEEVERRFYEEHFQHLLDERNRKYIEYRKKDHVWDMERFISSKQYAPENTLFQIGNRDEHIGTDLQAVYEFTRTNVEHAIVQKYGRLPYVTLDSAIHFDETTPHVHERKVWVYHDEQGRECIGQEKALEEIGIQLPNPDMPVSRTNNRKMTFDAEILKLTQEVVKSFGYDIETEPVPTRKTRKKQCNLEEYIRDENERLIKENKSLERQIASKEEQLSNTEERLRDTEERLRRSEDRVARLEEQERLVEHRISRLQEKATQAEEIIARAEEAGGRWEQATFLSRKQQKDMVRTQLRQEFHLQTPFDDFDR